MTDNPATTREFVEFAVARIVDTRFDLPGSTWQHIMRFFRGDAGKARIAYVCEPPRTEVWAEDRTPVVVSTMLTVRISSNMHDQENFDQDQVSRNMLGLIYDATAFQNALNTAMAPDYSNLFNCILTEPQGDAETRVEGHRQIAIVKTNIWLPPPELALAWIAENPNPA